VDWKDIPEGVDHDDYLNTLMSKVQELVRETGRDDTLYTIPTKNGIHVICRPFNLAKFRVDYAIDVHKDNPSILYCA
jgi:hypothetical protein